MLKVLLIFCAFGLVSCSSQRGTSIQSFPEKAVVSVETSNGETRALGETPLQLKDSDVFDSQTGMSQLYVTKDGYESQKVFLARNNERESFEVSVKLRPNGQDIKSERSKDRQEQLAKSLARISNLMNKKKYDEAEKLLSQLTMDYPHVSVGWDYLGNISFLRRDFKSAQNFYRRSLNINPDNVETRQMIEKLDVMSN